VKTRLISNPSRWKFWLCAEIGVKVWKDGLKKKQQKQGADFSVGRCTRLGKALPLCGWSAIAVHEVGFLFANKSSKGI